MDQKKTNTTIYCKGNMERGETHKPKQKKYGNVQNSCKAATNTTIYCKTGKRNITRSGYLVVLKTKEPGGKS